MIRHIVMWKLKEGVDGRSRQESAREMQRLLEQLPGRIPQLLALRVGLADADSESDMDVVLESSFDDWAALAAYQAHPEHLAVAEFVKRVWVERHVVDYLL